MGKRGRSARAAAKALADKNSSARSAFLGVLAARVAAGGRVPLELLTTPETLALEFGVAVEPITELMRTECLNPEEVRLDRAAGKLVATSAGRAKIRALLDARMAAAPAPAPAAPPAPSPAPAPAGPKTDTLIITRPHWSQKRVVADRESNGREVICCVQSAANFAAGMKLEGAHEGDGGLWYYTGRLPRRKGHW